MRLILVSTSGKAPPGRKSDSPNRYHERVDISSLDEMKTLIDEFGEVVISAPSLGTHSFFVDGSENEYWMEVYDCYRE